MSNFLDRYDLEKDVSRVLFEFWGEAITDQTVYLISAALKEMLHSYTVKGFVIAEIPQVSITGSNMSISWMASPACIK